MFSHKLEWLIWAEGSTSYCTDWQDCAVMLAVYLELSWSYHLGTFLSLCVGLFMKQHWFRFPTLQLGSNRVCYGSQANPQCLSPNIAIPVHHFLQMLLLKQVISSIDERNKGIASILYHTHPIWSAAHPYPCLRYSLKLEAFFFLSFSLSDFSLSFYLSSMFRDHILTYSSLNPFCVLFKFFQFQTKTLAPISWLPSS
jgi:hypothetical protein